VRNLSQETLKEVFAEFMPTSLTYLLRIVYEDNDGVIHTARYAQSYTPIESNSEVYQPAAFRISLANDEANGMPAVNLIFDAGNRSNISKLREYDKKPLVYLQVVVVERPDVVEIPEIEFEVMTWTIQGNSVSAQLKVEPILDEPIPGDLVTPTLFPFLFENVTVSDGTGQIIGGGGYTPINPDPNPPNPPTDPNIPPEFDEQ